MGGWFYRMGRRLGPRWRKSVWAWQSLAGSQAQRIEAEYGVGRDLAAQMENQARPMDPDHPADRLLQGLGRRLAGCVADKRLRWRFAVLPDGRPNAFALPGGFIYFHAALVDLCQGREGELAFVCAHEIGHVVKGHAMKRMIEQSALSMAVLSGPGRGALGAWLKRVGWQFFAGAYSQEHELEADRFAVRLMHAAGFDPRGAVALLERLGRLEQAPALPLSRYLSTHPPIDWRLAQVRRLLAVLHKPGRPAAGGPGKK